MMEKPISIVKKEFEDALSDLVNNSGLPAMILRPLFADVTSQLSRLEQQQLEQDIQMYNAENAKPLAESEVAHE